MDSWQERIRRFWKQKKWSRTHDLSAYKPNFKMLCRFCKDNDGERVEMIFRYCMLFHPGDKAGKIMYSFDGAGAQIAFKCPRCGYHTRFNIPDKDEYIEKIYDMRVERGYKSLWYPTPDQWSEDKYLKRQLEGLGYIGG